MIVYALSCHHFSVLNVHSLVGLPGELSALQVIDALGLLCAGNLRHALCKFALGIGPHIVEHFALMLKADKHGAVVGVFNLIHLCFVLQYVVVHKPIRTFIHVCRTHDTFLAIPCGYANALDDAPSIVQKRIFQRFY